MDADGTLICWNRLVDTYSCTVLATVAGSLYYDPSGTGQRFTYPAAFIDIPTVAFTVGEASVANGVTYIAGAASAGTPTESPYFTVLALNSAPNRQVALCYISIGHWS